MSEPRDDKRPETGPAASKATADLEARIARARGQREAQATTEQTRQVDVSGMSRGFRLASEFVAAVIVGARNREHLAANLKIAAITLSDVDRAEIGAALAQRRGPEGDTFELERDREGRHGRIMKYNLSKVAS